MWLEWSADAFARARTEGKPVLLSITASWCHGCAVMDRVAYGDPEDPVAVSLQPHPEFGADFMDALLALRAGTAFPVEDAVKARASLAQPVANEAWARLIVDYFHRAAEARAAA